ncbi:CBS domain-containing protein [Streptococcus macacae]|uniref:CBS domain protein n=1 Tax=Streptococcus macacae NCTC 11558 TaxID=764298 RepID=G5JYD8_9STRE|nr:CBS domain-containing protein [Streptococcus macacae]EHJ51934.1 CBS domain protein [Streptococcus macacae NCTC 11558]SUN78051.1 acetoin utilization protein, acetoin dehydrogenase [Streptococcus macacae NCTC 11558]
MPVKDFMSKKVVYVSPDTTVAKATDIMREKRLRRLPVIENDKLVGLVTEGTIAEATPSKATSLSIYEMNYLLNKTKIRDVMIHDVITISKDAHLEDAIYLMMNHKIGVLPVVDEEQISGIITDKDIFKAFLEVSGYGQEGMRLTIIVDDKIGILEQIIKAISTESLNIRRILVADRKSGKVRIEIQLSGKCDAKKLQQKLEEQGFEVRSIAETQRKEII